MISREVNLCSNVSSTYWLCGLGKVLNLSGLFLYLPIRVNNTYPTAELQKVSEMSWYKELMSTMGEKERTPRPGVVAAHFGNFSALHEEPCDCIRQYQDRSNGPCHSAKTDYDMTYLGKPEFSGLHHARMQECPFLRYKK